MPRGLPVKACLLSALVLGSAPAWPALAESPALPSLVACPPSLVGRLYGDCLRREEAVAAKALADALGAARESIEKADGAPAPQRARRRRLFDDAQAQWARYRATECQDVAPFEAANKARVFEQQAACRLDRDAARAADLRARYAAKPGA